MPTFDVYDELRAIVRAMAFRTMAEPDVEIDERLRILAAKSAEWMASPEGRERLARSARDARLRAVVDMSPEGLDLRLRRLAAVTALCFSLRAVAAPRSG